MADDPNTAVTTTGPKPPLTVLNRLIVLDAAVSLLIHDLFLPLPRSLLKTLEISGDGRIWFPIPISVLPFSSPLYFPLLLSLLLGSLLDLLLVAAIKVLVRRPRPVYNKNMTLVVSVDHWSFPSGHSSRVFFIAFFLYLSVSSSSASIVLGDHTEMVVRGVFMWAAATSVSRVLLARHFVFDVVAGASLGLAEAIFVHRFLKFYCLREEGQTIHVQDILEPLIQTTVNMPFLFGSLLPPNVNLRFIPLFSFSSLFLVFIGQKKGA